MGSILGHKTLQYHKAPLHNNTVPNEGSVSKIKSGLPIKMACPNISPGLVG